MNVPFLVAGILSAIAALVHGIAGEVTTVRPLVAAEINDVPKQELRAVWYMVTVHLAASAVALFLLTFSVAVDDYALVGRFLAVQFLCYGLTFLGLAVVKPGRLFQLPQWILLFLIAGFTYWGTL